MRIELSVVGPQGFKDSIDLQRIPGRPPARIKVLPGGKVAVSVDGVKLDGHELVDGKKVVLKKTGKDLALQVEGETVAELVDFYEAPGAVLEGSAWTYASEHEGLAVIADQSGISAVDEASRMSAEALSLPESGYVLAGVGIGVLALAGGGGGGKGGAVAAMALPPPSGPLPPVPGDAPGIAIAVGVAGDDVINAAEKAGGVTIRGTTSGVEDGQLVSVGWGGVVKAAVVSGGAWAVTFAAGEVPADADASTITADVSNRAGSTAHATHQVAIDSAAPTVVIAAQIAGDNHVDAIEKSAGVEVKGTTSGVEDGQWVSVTWGTVTKTAQVSGNAWSVTFAASDVPADAAATVITATVTDRAGNESAPDSRTVAVDTSSPAVAIAGQVAVDDVVNAVEKAAGVTISGTTLGVESGQTVTVVWGTVTKTATVSGGVGGGTWSAFFGPGDIPADAASTTVTANVSNAAGTSAWPATHQVAIDTAAPTATIAMSDTALAVGESSTVTITFSEAVVGFDNGDLVVSNGSLSPVSSTDGGKTWTATFTPSTNIEAGSNLIQLAAGGATDAAGNANAAAASPNYAIDTKAPTATIAMSDVALAAGETSVVTITFSEAVTGFTSADLTVVNGSLGAASSSDGGKTWTATFTPDANVESSTNLIQLAAGVATDAAGNGNAPATSANYTVDTKAPTATITMSDTALAVGETSVVTITFSEAVTGFDNTDLTVANGSLSAVSSSDGGKTWTATFTPSANVDSAVNLIHLAAGGALDAAGNGNVAADSPNYAVSTQALAVSISMADTALKAGETSLVTITFSNPVTGFDNTDLAVGGGSLSPVSSSDGGKTWTATFTPTAGLEQASNLIQLAGGAATDAAGNTNASTSSPNYAIDTRAPTLSITDDNPVGAVNAPVTYTFTFSEDVTGFDASDITVTHGTKGAFTAVNGKTYTLEVTPPAGAEGADIGVTVGTGLTDLAGNPIASSTAAPAQPYDTLAPTVAISTSKSSLKVGDTALLTFTFSEVPVGFDVTDVSVSGGQLSGFAVDPGDAKRYTATFTPQSGLQGSAVVSIASGAFSDDTGNDNADGADANNTVSMAVDTKAPTAIISMSDTALKVGETSVVTITFSEAVTGFDNNDLTVDNGTLTSVTSSDGGITWTATFTPLANLEDASNVIRLAAGGVADAAGNTNAVADSPNYTIDTQAPTATITMSDTTLAVGETSVVTIAFSEAVSGFNNADLTVANGSLSAVSSTDGGKTWTATFTPNANVESATNLIHLAAGGALDAAGNANAAADSPNYSIDTHAPTLAVTSYAAAENQTSVATLAGTDSSTISYSLVGGADASLFTLSGTGVLSFKAAPDYEAPGSSAGSNAYALQVRMTDAAGNYTDQAITVNVTDVAEGTAAPALTATQNLDDVTNLDVRSALVLTFDQSSLSLGSGQIRIMDDMGTNGWTVRNTTTGESKQDVSDNDVVITLTNGAITGLTVGGVDRSAYMAGAVTISGNKLIINPSDRDTVNDATWNFDWDFGANYHVELDAGVITGAGGLGNAAMTDSTRLNFKTVTPADAASGAASQKMNVADGSLSTGTIWHNGHVQDDSMNGLALDFSTGSHAVYVQSDGGNSRTTTIAGKVLVSGFGSDDLLYMDNLGNVTMATTEGQIGGSWGASGNDISRYLNNSDGGLNERVVLVDYLLTGTGVNNVGGDKIFENSAHANANVIVFG